MLNLGKQIGTTRAGNKATQIRVIIRDNVIQTAHPK